MNASFLKLRSDHKSAPVRRFQARVVSDRLRCLGYVKALEESFHAETVHRLRTHLRRLQSYAEFVEERRTAARLGRGVSWFSRLRALSEFQRYLRRSGAGAKDVRRVKKALRKEQNEVRKADRANAVRALLAEITTERLRRLEEFLIDRLQRLQIENRTVLGEALQGLPPKPKRKELHGLRLLVKSLRYQQELSAQVGWGNPQTVEAFKRLQAVLGKYCDRDQFIRLAKELDLGCRKAIKKDRRRARARARRAVLKLRSKHLQPLLPLRGPVWLVKPL
jgi:CHAD domain-containing protein